METQTNAVETQADATKLKRVFGLPTLIIYGVGDILGAGIYAVVGKIAGLSGTLVWASFLVAMVVAALTALSYAELGSRIPQSGGVACFVNRAFRTDWLSVLVGWLMFCTCLVSMATLSKAFAGYLNAFIPVIPDWFIILALFSVLAFVNFRGMQESSALNIFCTTLEVSGLLIVVLVSVLFLLGNGATAQALPIASAPSGQTVGWLAVVQGAALAFYAFVGFEDIVNVAEEVKNPERNLPRAILLALAIAGGVYILVSWLAVQVISPSELAASNAPLLDVVRQAQPNFPSVIFTVIALFAVLNTALLNFITASRLLYGMAREGLLPAWLGKLHRSRQTPYRTLIVILPIAIFLALSGTLQFLAGTTATLILAMFCLVNLSLLIIKRREPRSNGFRVPLPIPALALLLNLILVAFASRESHILALAFVGIGVLLIGIQSAVKKQRSHSL
ncbi:APC family permease [Leptolyngbya sp. FACHB-711]|uniref:APC family permease n=1 Tax=unclassified Leptolyngbya TaxID=2650499 RepID=UPI001685858A|nr:APC family permease [Leptolyngbya sp. FACHB-711]MBD1851477.1 amino acid permease [Cyanobacteria bacterium FACHB-502]MBD2027348.1 amino acid permease [Leptolyngbya sp. FACHB-711]